MTPEAPPVRDARGRINPGQTLNPGGRPKGAISLVRILRESLEKSDGAGARAIMANLEALALRDDRTAVEATKVILDRTDGAVVRETKGEVRLVMEGIQLQERLPPRIVEDEGRILEGNGKKGPYIAESVSKPMQPMKGSEVVDTPEGPLTVSQTAPRAAPPPTPSLSPAQKRSEERKRKRVYNARVYAKRATKAGRKLDGRTLAGRIQRQQQEESGSES